MERTGNIRHGMHHVGNAPAGTKRYTKFEGSFGPPLLIAQLHIDYADGSREVIVTTETISGRIHEDLQS